MADVARFPVLCTGMSDATVADIAHLQPGRSPILDDAQIELLGRYGRESDIAAGDVLFAPGDETYDLIVILEGGAEVVQDQGRPTESVIVTYGPREFLGELGLLTGQRVFLMARATAAGRILRVPVDQLRAVMAQELDLSELILRAFLLRHSILTHLETGLTLIGSHFHPDTRRLLEVLARNRLPSKWLDLESSPDAEMMLRELEVPVEDLPIVIVPGGPFLRNPSSRQLLDALGLSVSVDHDPADVCDLLVVGGGPAGLAASVYGASEGMSTTLAEDTALGGQAGTSSRIENYLGFPAGLSGADLARRAVVQAKRFGVEILAPQEAVGVRVEGPYRIIKLADGNEISCHALMIASGVQWRRLEAPGVDRLQGAGVYYGGGSTEALSCKGEMVYVVGGANSAGQAAMNFAKYAERVVILVRGDSLSSTMSQYLIDQIKETPNIQLWTHASVSEVHGDTHLEEISVLCTDTNKVERVPASAMFIFIGALPRTDWLAGTIERDERGFVLTGPDVMQGGEHPKGWALERDPFLLETNVPGIFAVGDVRHGSVKRVASGVGEGSVAVQFIHQYLSKV